MVASPATTRSLVDLTETRNLDRIIASESERFRQQMPRSAEMTEIAKQNLAGGVTSSWQISEPHPIWIDSGRGSRVSPDR